MNWHFVQSWKGPNSDNFGIDIAKRTNLRVIYRCCICICKIKSRKTSNFLIYLKICSRFYCSRTKNILQLQNVNLQGRRQRYLLWSTKTTDLEPCSLTLSSILALTNCVWGAEKQSNMFPHKDGKPNLIDCF